MTHPKLEIRNIIEGLPAVVSTLWAQVVIRHKLYMVKLSPKTVDAILIIVLGLIALLWFEPGCLILDPDSNFPLDPQMRFSDRLFAWSSNFQTGNDQSVHFATIIYYGFQALLSNVFNLIVIEKLSYVILFMLPGFSMYFLMSQIYVHNSWARVARLVAAVFYMFNFYQLFIWPRLILGTGGLIITPVFLGMLIKLLKNEISLGKDLFILSFSTVVGATIGLQPPFVGTLFVILFGYLIFYVISKKKITKMSILSSGSKLLLILSIFCLCSAFWLLPTSNFVLQSGYLNSQVAKEVFDTDWLLGFVSQHTSFTNVIRFHGDFSWFESWGGQPYNAWFEQYRSDIFLTIMSFVFPILAFSALLFRKDKYVLFFSIISLISIFLAKGTHEPFADVFIWLYNNIPGFWIYRAPWQKFTILYSIGYSVLMGITCGNLYHYLKSRFNSFKFSLIRKYFPISVVWIILLLNFYYLSPLISGENFPSSEGEYGYAQYYNVGVHTKVPPYIFDSANWLNQQKEEFNVLLLPDEKSNVYDWGYAATGDVSLMLINKGLLFRQYGQGMATPHPVEKNYSSVVDYIYSGKYANITKFLGLMNIKYILQRNDFRYDFYGDTDSPEFIQARLASQKDLKLERTFGEWEFYRVPDEYLNPHIYPVATPVLVDGGTDEMLIVAGSEDFVPLNEAVFLSTQLSRDKALYLQSSIDHKVVNRKMYMIRTHDSSKTSFNWNDLPSDSIEARYYAGWKMIIVTDGTKKEDLLSFPHPDECPYQFPSFVSKLDKAWSALDSTIVFIKTGKRPLFIKNINERGDTVDVKDIVGIWWETDWMGMSTKPVTYPVRIPPYQKAIVQINRKTEELTIESIDLTSIEESNVLEINNANIVFQEANPTKYKIQVEASQPFCLVFSEAYHPHWKAFVDDEGFRLNEIMEDYENTGVREARHERRFYPLDISYLLAKPLPEADHFIANGYANAWYIDPRKIDKDGDGRFAITLNFQPQGLFYVGLFISLATFIACIVYLLYGCKIKLTNSFRSLRGFFKPKC